MVKHIDLGANGFAQKRTLVKLILTEQVSLGGNSKLKIYGKLDCRSGKRMKAGNRVFFKDETEALSLGYRPCGHCMPDEYQKWKEKQSGKLKLLETSNSDAK